MEAWREKRARLRALTVGGEVRLHLLSRQRPLAHFPVRLHATTSHSDDEDRRRRPRARWAEGFGAELREAGGLPRSMTTIRTTTRLYITAMERFEISNSMTRCQRLADQPDSKPLRPRQRYRLRDQISRPTEEHTIQLGREESPFAGVETVGGKIFCICCVVTSSPPPARHSGPTNQRRCRRPVRPA